jgi:hypothetical protein
MMVDDGVLDTVEDMKIRFKDDDGNIKEIDGQKINVLNGDGLGIFMFLAENTDSEFSFSCFANGNEYVSTSFQKGEEHSAGKLINENGKIDRHFHSHPAGELPNPSSGDIKAAEHLRVTKKYNTQMSIYSAETKSFIDYDENSASFELEPVYLELKRKK